MTHQEVRTLFLDFFATKKHDIVPSSKIFLQDDPSLLFVNAGMNQFKDIFMGRIESPFLRVVDSQKCLRVSGKHNDLDDVGVDHYHHTFFEMLGSWSFSDYGKKEAIIWGWELLTQIYRLDKGRLWVTVHDLDQETFHLWRECTDIVSDHVLLFGDKENFWTMGTTGPCGPCTELHYDLGESACGRKEKHDCTVNGPCGRYIELWNIVFMELQQDIHGSRIPLNHKYIDTGMGLERITRVLQNKSSNYDTDIFQPILQKIEELSGKFYPQATQQDQVSFRVLADHIRALCFAIADGVIPSNNGRGYAIRRILRRAYRYGQNLGMPEVFLCKLVPTVVDIMGEHFSELRTAQQRIIQTIQEEEKKFSKTLISGLSLFEKEIQKLSSSTVSGRLAFVLFDTYGFPVDLTSLLAQERGLSIDMDEFHLELENQRRLSREGQKIQQKKTTEGFHVLDASIQSTQFLGYETLEAEGSKITKYCVDGDYYQIVLDKTPFYAEGGGQVADQGVLYSPHFTMYVEDVQKTPQEYIHYGHIEGFFEISGSISTKVEKERREALTRHHTGVHILNAVLEKILGRRVEFNSTYVAEDYFFCDLPAPQKLSPEEIFKLEEEFNRIIESCIPTVFHTFDSLEEATALGITSRFEDRLGDKELTRVIEVPGVTIDLCGGTHISNTGELGVFKILSDSSAGANLRHLECVCGMKAWRVFHKLFEESRTISYELKCGVKDVPSHSLGLMQENKNLKKEMKKLRLELMQYKYTIDTLKQIGSVHENPFYYGVYEDASMPNIQYLGRQFVEKSPSSFVLLIAPQEGQSLYAMMCGDRLSEGNSLQDIHHQFLSTFNAKGGGKLKSFNGSFLGYPDESKLQIFFSTAQIS